MSKPLNQTSASATRPSAGQPVSKTAVAAPDVKAADGRSGLLALLKVEQDARDCASVRDLTFLMANETRKLTRARQIFVLMPGPTKSLHVKAISSLSVVDRNAPVVSLIEGVVQKAAAELPGLDSAGILPLHVAGQQTSGSETYPFHHLYWMPLKHGGKTAVGGLVLAREDSWADQDVLVAQRLASTYAHAWTALEGRRRGLTTAARSISRRQLAAGAAVLVALMFVKVPLSALAPVEIVAREPFVVAAPIDGVIDTIAVDPNEPVKPGDLLVKLNDTALRNRFEVANRDADVSAARLKQAHRSAFNDTQGMHEIGIARAELEMKVAERDFAKALLDKTEIHAKRSGMAVYADKRELIGRPVAVGERILEVADPDAVEARISLPVADAITLSPGARVKLFLDSDPLTPWTAAVKRADYKAKVGDSDIVSFRVVATLDADESRPVPRLGVRGTAQISGQDVPLWLYLFRRPLTAVRQWTGL